MTTQPRCRLEDYTARAAEVLEATKQRYPWTLGKLNATFNRGGTTYRPGGVGGPGAQPRTDIAGNILPEYRVSSGNGLPHPLFDTSSVMFWRWVFVAAALAYIYGFHVALGGIRIRLGPAA